MQTKVGYFDQLNNITQRQVLVFQHLKILKNQITFWIKMRSKCLISSQTQFQTLNLNRFKIKLRTWPLAAGMAKFRYIR